tara:strand:- start:14 stop:235 length:222 start_codon:yes stop_codon:yes gene_type:complete
MPARTATPSKGPLSFKAVGKIVLEEADFEVSLAPSQDVNGDDLLDLRALELIPMGSSRLKKFESVAEERGSCL